MEKNILLPSLLNMDYTRIGDNLLEMKAAGVTHLHIDVMDGHFVPSFAIGVSMLQSIRQHTDMFLDVHLMIEEPIRYIKTFREAGADGITVHVETTNKVDSTIAAIKKSGAKAGLAINPATSVEELFPYLWDIDMALVMTVEPGYGGQKLIPHTLGKVKALKAALLEKNLSRDIEVDGGVTLENVTEVLFAGANMVVAGSAVFKGYPEENARKFLEIMQV